MIDAIEIETRRANALAALDRPERFDGEHEIARQVIDADIPRLEEREAIQAEAKFAEALAEISGQTAYIESAPAFLAAVDPPLDYLVNDLIPEGVLALLHGEPRTRKSWAGLDIGIAVATGTPAFNLERFTVPRPAVVLYLSQEDSARLVRQRAKALLRGRAIATYPELLAFSIHRGVDLESAEWHQRLIDDVKARGIRLLIFDPIRRFAVNVDKGPAEVRVITAYLRRLVTETGCTVLIVHHDTKPSANGGPDLRRRAQKASGGDWFASCECPISFELSGDSETMGYPSSYKVSSDPEPFSLTLETDDPRNPTTARLIGKTTTSADAMNTTIDNAVIAYLTNSPGASQRAIMKATRKGGDTIAESLDRLFKLDAVDCVDLGKGKGKKWTLRGGVPGVLARSEHPLQGGVLSSIEENTHPNTRGARRKPEHL